jgi:glycosyltransferase involved in cell wall biosynthesis
MIVVLEAQHAVGRPQPRGAGYYSINLIQALLRRKAFDYELTFFDYKHEVDNLSRAREYFGNFRAPFKECNALDYRVASRDEYAYSAKPYNAWTNTWGKVYHFMNLNTFPVKLDGKMILTIHDITWRAYPGMISPHVAALLDIALKRLKRLKRVKPFVIAVSQAARSQILQFTDIPSERVEVIYQSCDESNMYPDKTDVSAMVDGEYVLYLGAWDYNKNIVRIVEAFDCVAQKYSGLKLVLAGKPVWNEQYSEQIHEVVRASPFRERIVMPGYVDVETKRRLMSSALCFVFPSICEGFGIPVLEAMACGCPVITADNTSLPEVGGDAAIYINAFDTGQLAFEMERVVSSESLRKNMIAKGSIQAKRFSWDKTAEQVENIYRMVAKN